MCHLSKRQKSRNKQFWFQYFIFPQQNHNLVYLFIGLNYLITSKNEAAFAAFTGARSIEGLREIPIDLDLDKVSSRPTKVSEVMKVIIC